MKKKLSILLALVLVFSVFAVACGGGKEEPTEEASEVEEPAEEAPEAEEPAEEEASDEWPRDFIIGYAGLDESQEHLIPVGDNIEKIAAEKSEELGIEITVLRVDNAGDGTKAIENVDTLLLQGIDVLVEFNADSAVNDTIAEMCAEAGVPVMAIDIPVGNAPFMGADNYGSGFKCGEALGDLVNEEWGGVIDGVLFEDTPRVGEIAVVRMNSIWDGIASKTDYTAEELEAMTVRVDYEDDGIKAQQLCADYLLSNPDKKNIVVGCMNDIGAMGAFSAIEAADRDDHCLIVNHGVSVQTRQNLYEQNNTGKLTSWRGGVSYFLERYGEYIVPGCIELVQGTTPAAEDLLMDHEFIHAGNVEDWYPEAEWSQ